MCTSLGFLPLLRLKFCNVFVFEKKDFLNFYIIMQKDEVFSSALLNYNERWVVPVIAAWRLSDRIWKNNLFNTAS